MSIILVSAICALNIILWIVFFHKFSSLFSTDDIIETTRAELNKMIADVNRTTERNINLVEDRITQLKKILSDADRKIALLSSEQKKYEITSAYKTSLNGITSEKRDVHGARTSSIQTVASKYKKNAGVSQKRNPDREASYALTQDGFKQIAPEEKQAVLFDDVGKNNVNGADEKKNEAAYADVPVIAPKVYLSENPITKRKDFAAEVRKLYEKGETIDEIASALSSSVTEVQFAIDMTDDFES
ncbi:MAG: hypothetical protein LKF96_00140 [Treponema sp.]|nr:hypothetical protein [Treponema sp.]